MKHWHNVLVERKDDSQSVLLGTYLSSEHHETKDEAACAVARLLEELTELNEAAIASARESLISEKEGVQLARWAHASREFRLVECDDCEETIRDFRVRLAAEVRLTTGRPVSFAQPPPVG